MVSINLDVRLYIVAGFCNARIARHARGAIEPKVVQIVWLA